MSTWLLRNTGEPRTWFGDFLHTLFPSVGFYSDFVFHYKCKDGLRSRVMPDGDLPETTSIHIYPMLLHNKTTCKEQKMGTHTVYTIMNSNTHEWTILNPLHYNTEALGSYGFKQLIKSYPSAFSKWYTAKTSHPWSYGNIVFPRKSIHNLIKKAGTDDAHVWYPLAVCWFVDLMTKNPSLKCNELLALMEDKETLESHVLQRWIERMDAFYATKVYNRNGKGRKVCRDKIYHPELQRCYATFGEMGMKLLNIKDCGEDGVYDFHEKQCQTFKFIGNDRVSNTQSIDIDTYVGDVFGSKPLFTYLRKKYPHAAFYDKDIHWLYDASNSTGELDTGNAKEFMEKAIKNKRIKQVVLFVVLYTKGDTVSHANVLVYTKGTDEFELFEPLGLDASDKASREHLYPKLKDYFGRRILFPEEYCPKGLSVFQSLECDEKVIWDTDGYCAVWSVLYTEVRLLNPTLPTKDVVKFAMQVLSDKGSLRQYIWSYDRWMRRQLKK